MSTVYREFSNNDDRLDYVRKLKSIEDTDYDEKNISLEDYVKRYWDLSEIPDEGIFLEKIFKSDTGILEDAYKAVQSVPGAREFMKTKKKGWGPFIEKDENFKFFESEINKKLTCNEHSNSSYCHCMINVEDIIKNGWVSHLSIRYK